MALGLLWGGGNTRTRVVQPLPVENCVDTIRSIANFRVKEKIQQFGITDPINKSVYYGKSYYDAVLIQQNDETQQALVMGTMRIVNGFDTKTEEPIYEYVTTYCALHTTAEGHYQLEACLPAPEMRQFIKKNKWKIALKGII